MANGERLSLFDQNISNEIKLGIPQNFQTQSLFKHRTSRHLICIKHQHVIGIHNYLFK